MVEIKQQLLEMLVPLLDRHNAFLVDVVLRHDRGTRLVQVLVDTDRGVTIEECAEISRDLGRMLDAEGIFRSSYHLEVSSPGIDKPLRYLRQYHKNIGRRFKVTYTKEGERTSFVGKLEAIAENALTFALDSSDVVTVDFSHIIESKEELPW
jgi:ribosome maturation factor RimP